MRKRLRLSLAALLCASVFLFSGCAGGNAGINIDLAGEKESASSSADIIQSILDTVTGQHTVTFCMDGQTTAVKVDDGKQVSMPASPKKENYIFLGWFTDSGCSNRYDFSSAVEKDLTLYAGFTLDAASLTNEITLNTVKSLVTVVNMSYNSRMGVVTASVTEQGSGVIFAQENGYYYLLTNCHVAVKATEYSSQKITVNDYLGNEYSGTIYSGKGTAACSADYDLACISFRMDSETPLAVCEISSDPQTGDDVISLGAPLGQRNAITFGEVKGKNSVTLNTETYQSNVQFPVLRHSAPIDHGSSGGPLLNSELKICGINYAGTENGGAYYAIPTEKVNEFLAKYVYS